MGVSLIIAAGGQGSRFLKGQKRKKIPGKVFFPLGPRPILSHALASFQKIPQIREILLAIPRGTEQWVRSHILEEKTGPPIRLVPGGATRAESVWNALRKSSPQNDWILVHDGARPFPPRKLILELLRKRSGSDGIILVRPVTPTLKRVSPKKGQILETVDRTHLFEAETPQLVRRSFLLKAYRSNPHAYRATDESSLVESLGGRVKVLAHTGWNVKVTTPEDLRLAEAYYRGQSPKKGTVPFWTSGGTPRNDEARITVGFGRDTHRLVPGRPFYLGGVRIPFEKGTLGHSDGDALLHAIADALLGALGLGDIGEWFPTSNPRFKDMRSGKMVEKILKETRRKGWQPERIDTVVLLEKPRLTPHKKKIQKKIARLLGISSEAVSIKAKTQEGLGPEGEGRAVTSEALVTLGRV